MFLPEENELLDENLNADTGYFHMSYLSVREAQWAPQTAQAYNSTSNSSELASVANW